VPLLPATLFCTDGWALAKLLFEHQDRWIWIAGGHHHKLAWRHYVDYGAAAADAAGEGASAVGWGGGNGVRGVHA